MCVFECAMNGHKEYLWGKINEMCYEWVWGIFIIEKIWMCHKWVKWIIMMDKYMNEPYLV